MVSGRRDGLSLIEAIVALVLLGAGVLTIGAASTRALGTLRGAEARDGARTAMVSVADSIAQYASPSGGTVRRGRYTVVWTVADSGLIAHAVVRVVWADGSELRSDAIRVTTARPPARLRVVP